MDDLISRQAAIDAVQQHRESVLGKYEYDEGVAFVYAAAHNHIINVIKQLPSAQQWIPCSERLPDIHEEVLTCDNYGTQRVYTLTRISDDVIGWENDYGFYQFLEDVQAWMPLPEPYKGENDG